jgi:hypothetical protein
VQLLELNSKIVLFSPPPSIKCRPVGINNQVKSKFPTILTRAQCKGEFLARSASAVETIAILEYIILVADDEAAEAVDDIVAVPAGVDVVADGVVEFLGAGGLAVGSSIARG